MHAAIAYFLICVRIIILGKIKAMFLKIYFRNVNAIVKVLLNVFMSQKGPEGMLDFLEDLR